MYWYNIIILWIAQQATAIAIAITQDTKKKYGEKERKERRICMFWECDQRSTFAVKKKSFAVFLAVAVVVVAVIEWNFH